MMRSLSFLLLFLCTSLWGLAQASYNMSNLTVGDCEGLFFDSQSGTTPGNYNHDENLTFTICVPASDSIVLVFSDFCTEAGNDVIRFFDGSDTLSPMIGLAVSGATASPGTIVATSGCLTINFISDASVSCYGWSAAWHSIINSSDPPIITPFASVSCNQSSLNVNIDLDFYCDSLSPSNFSIIGPVSQTVTSVTPIACSGGATHTAQVNFSPGFSSNGTYTLIFAGYLVDMCGNLHFQNASISVVINDCPLSVQISATDTLICIGDCIDLTATAWGGTAPYSYSWSGGVGSGAGPHTVCPTTTTTYSVTATDASAAPPGTDNITITVVPLPSMPPDFTICQSASPVSLSATPAGGFWFGPGIYDSTSNIFDPTWVTGTRTLTYRYNGCENTMNVTVTPMSAGLPQAACPGSAPFNLMGSPAGGTWGGSGVINPATGLFDPSVVGVGTHLVYYSNGVCPNDTTYVNIQNISIPTDDTICQNLSPFSLSFSPIGGVWSGTGIINSYWGIVNPRACALGANNLIYTVHGCADTFVLTTIGVNAGPDITACPTQTPFNLSGATPTGGFYWGTGIIDSINGTFNPGFAGGAAFSPYIYYNYMGCVDTMRVFNYYTRLTEDSIGPFCPYDAYYVLDYTNTGRSPYGGVWSGTGITVSASNGRFDPVVAGSGMHKLYYTMNGCADSLYAQVFSNPNLRDTVVCERQSPFILPHGTTTGIWGGAGIINPLSGLFSASVATVGTHTINYATNEGCFYNLNVQVDTNVRASLSGFTDALCFNDTLLMFTASPAGGVWSSNASGGMINPYYLGSGSHTVSYTVGTGDCSATASSSFNIRDTLRIEGNFQDTTLCASNRIRMEAFANGGDLSNYFFVWNDSMGTGTIQIIEPDVSASYTVTVSDGCSQEVSTTFNVQVQSAMSIQFSQSDKICFNDLGWAAASVSPSGNYSFHWSNGSVDDSIIDLAGYYYQLTVTDLNSNCQLTDEVMIPSFERIIADFITSPNGQCASLLDPNIQFIDQSIGGVEGGWIFGDDNDLIYTPGQNPTHTYRDSGTYTVYLFIKNEGGCSDRVSLDVCIDPINRIFAPTAFSPNNDGVNDVFNIKTVGAENEVLQIFNRWGELVYETNNLKFGWDGYHKERACEMGVYVWQLKYRNIENDFDEVQSGSFMLLR